MNELLILETYQQRAHLLEAAEVLWNNLAEQMAKLIPPSMHKFAKQYRWIKSEVDGSWGLSEFLENLVVNSKEGKNICTYHTKSTLSSSGFSSFEELEGGLRELEKAWSGLIKIEIDESAGWLVRYFAAEAFQAKQEETAVEDT